MMEREKKREMRLIEDGLTGKTEREGERQIAGGERQTVVNF